MSAATARQPENLGRQPEPAPAAGEPAIADWGGASPARELQRQLARRLDLASSPASQPDAWSPRRKAAIVAAFAALSWAATVSIAFGAHAILAAL